MALMMSLAPVISESYVNLPMDVARATEAVRMPGRLRRLLCIKWTQEEQVMPVIYKTQKQHYTGHKRYLQHANNNIQQIRPVTYKPKINNQLASYRFCICEKHNIIFLTLIFILKSRFFWGVY